MRRLLFVNRLEPSRLSRLFKRQLPLQSGKRLRTMEDGTIPAEQMHVLKELGAWNKRNGEAVFNSIGGLPQGHFYGPSTLSKDSSTLYLFLHGSSGGNIMLKGLANKIEDITVLG